MTSRLGSVTAALFLVVHTILIPCRMQLFAHAFHRAPCTTTSIRRQFQFSDCYVPNLNPDIYLNQASVVMSHDSATGYLTNTKGSNVDDAEYQEEIANLSGNNDYYNNQNNNNQNNNNGNGRNSRWNTITTALLSLYGKTQVGTVYDQLNNGARALDLRPKIYNNGTIGFHHGSLIDIPLNSITLGGLLEDAKKWCKDNPKELVLIFHSEMVHEAGYNGLSSQVYMETDDVNDDGGGGDDANADGNDANVYGDNAYGYGDDQQQPTYEYIYSGIAALKAVYEASGVPYYSCDKLSGLTVSQAMTMADLSNFGGKGYLLAVDRHDMYASFCGKSNWAQDQLVSCYTLAANYNNNNVEGQRNGNENTQSYIQCTDRKNSGVAKLNDLKAYVTASANNDPSDDANELGPPEDESYYPFSQIQGLWQIDATSVQIGLLHASTLLEDNRISKVNEEMVIMAYQEQFSSINIFTMDNVALNGNAMFSVLRNQCGQSVLTDIEGPSCGTDLMMPTMETSRTLPIFWNIVLSVVYGALVVMVAVMLYQAFRLRNKGPQDHRLICHGHII